MPKVKPEMRFIYLFIFLLFTIFLLLPLAVLFTRSFETTNGIGISNYQVVFSNHELVKAFINSVHVSTITAILTTIISFTLAYTINQTNVYHPIKNFIKIGILVPMLLPTITYGFTIIYSFGEQGLLTKIVGKKFLDIYGFNGLLIGYIIYTVPASFLLINNAFQYIDKKMIIVSKLMGDGPVRSLFNTTLRPIIGAIGGAFVLSFILSFTDYGIPASLGGTYEVVATQLYQVMLGSIPNFNNGAVIAVFMLIPAAFGVMLLNYLEKYNFHHNKISYMEIIPKKSRDMTMGILSFIVVFSMLSVFVVMFLAPFVTSYPYQLHFTMQHFSDVFQSYDLKSVFMNSLFVSALTAILGTLIAYGAALMNVRTSMKMQARLTFDIFSALTNTVPGMVLGLSYLLFFNESSLKGTFTIIVLCNIVHLFTTPYYLAKNALAKLNASWETIGELMGDTWIKTVYRVILPNSISTILEMISYYFINSMVTISGIIFLVSAQTSLVASKIKDLQHFEKYNEIFVLSLLIFITNILMKVLSEFLQRKQSIHRQKRCLNKKIIKERDLYVKEI